MRALNIIVCVKPVPDSRYWDRLSLDPNTKLLRREGIPIVISPQDKNALEEALRIKEMAGGGKITCVSMGPPNTTDVLSAAYALGADECVLLSDRAFAGADTLATAAALAAGIKKIGAFDLVMFGNESLDGSTAQVGPQVAEVLDIAAMTKVEKVEFTHEDTVHVRTKIEGGYMVIEAKLPVALCVTSELNEVRLTPVMGAVWATEKKSTVWSVNDVTVDKAKIGLGGSPTYVPDIANINIARKGEVIKGEPADIARQLVEKLKADGVI